MDIIKENELEKVDGGFDPNLELVVNPIKVEVYMDCGVNNCQINKEECLIYQDDPERCRKISK